MKKTCQIPIAITLAVALSPVDSCRRVPSPNRELHWSGGPWAPTFQPVEVGEVLHLVWVTKDSATGSSTGPTALPIKNTLSSLDVLRQT